MKTLLFQGDSITESFRQAEYYKPIDCPLLGEGYVFLIAAALGRRQPGYRVLNRGVGGNRVDDVLARWTKDCLDLQPHVLTILLGVNDANPNRPVQPVEHFAATYRQLIQAAQRPGLQLILLEPFGLVLAPGERSFPVMTEQWRANLAPRQAVVHQLAADYRARFVPLQKVFDDAAQRAPAEHWAIDGIHPSAAGNQLIADAWLETMPA